MGILTDLSASLSKWLKDVADFFGIEEVTPEPEPIPEPPTQIGEEKPVTAIEPIVPSPEEGLPPHPFRPETDIGEKGRADRIETDPEPEAPFVEPPSVEDYPATIQFFVKDEDGIVTGANVTFLGQTKTTDSTGQCSISGRMKIMKNYPITASKAGYRTASDEISFASAPHPVYGSGYLGATKILYMERL